MSEWIDVKEKLPPSGKLVLVCNANSFARWQSVAHWSDYKKWWQRGIEELPWVVTHWQSLPAPPRGQAVTTKRRTTTAGIEKLLAVFQKQPDKVHDVLGAVLVSWLEELLEHRMKEEGL